MFKNLLLRRKLVRESCAALEELCTSQPLQCERGNFAAGMQQENLPQPEQSFEITSKLFLPVCQAYPGDVQAALYVISSNLLRNGFFHVASSYTSVFIPPKLKWGHTFFPLWQSALGSPLNCQGIILCRDTGMREKQLQRESSEQWKSYGPAAAVKFRSGTTWTRCLHFDFVDLFDGK